MSTIFALSDSDQKLKDTQAAMNAIPLDQAGVGFFHGVGSAIGQGIMKGGAKTAEGLLLADAGLELGVDAVFGTHYADESFAAIDKYAQPAVEYWTPDAGTVGTAGKVLGGFSEIVLPLMAGGGNPALMIGSQSLPTGKELIDQGVGAAPAVAVATSQAAAAGLGFKIPFLGSTLGKRMASGALGNLALNRSATAIDRQILKQTGNEQAAEQFDPLDKTGIAVDLLSGLAFGGIHHFSTPSILPSHVDAALTANNAKHFQHDTAPGDPADIPSSVAHQDALTKAVDDISRGEPVNVESTGVREANFVPRETVAQEVPAEYKEPIQLPEALATIPLGDGLNAADRAIETKFRKQIQDDPDTAIAAYEKLPDAGGGKILNTDVARELSPDYLTDRTKSAAVHEPASALVKEMYARKLAEAPKPGEKPLVVFSAGGTGAGKTTGLELTGIDKEAQIVYDSNMNSLASSVKRIDQALAAGKDVKILYTYRDPVEALTGGALPRAMRQEQKHGSGRTVPLAEHAKTHTGSAEVLHQLAEKYAGDGRVDIKVVDNSRGKDNAIETDLSVVPKKAHTDLVGKLHEALDKQFEAGNISESVYKGFKGDPVQQRLPDQGRERPVGETTGAGSGRPSEQSVERKLDPSVQAAHTALVDSDIQIPTGEIDAEGNPKTVSARELMAQAQAETMQAEKDANAFGAAVTCFLSNGAQ